MDSITVEQVARLLTDALSPKLSVCRWIAAMYADAYTNMMIGDSIKDAMGIGGEGGGSAAAEACNKIISTCVDEICPAACGIGIAIALTFFIISMIDLFTSERLTLEFFIKFFGKLAVSIGLITVSPQLLQACVDVGKALTVFFSGNFGNASAMSFEEIFVQYYNYFAAQEISWIVMAIESIFTIGVLKVASMALVIVVYVVAISRMLEMGIRGAFLPIALGMFADDGWRGAGGRYIRKFIAVCAQGAVLALVGSMSNVAITACANKAIQPGSGGGAGILITFGVAIASTSLMFKSIGIVNDVFGG